MNFLFFQIGGEKIFQGKGAAGGNLPFHPFTKIFYDGAPNGVHSEISWWAKQNYTKNPFEKIGAESSEGEDLYIKKNPKRLKRGNLK